MATTYERGLVDLDFDELLDISRRTQTCGLPGAGSPLLFISDPGTIKTAKIRSYCESINHWCEVIILGRIPSVDIGGIYAPNFDTGELQHMITHRLLGDIPSASGKDGICLFFDEVGNSMDEQQTALQSLIEDRCLEGRPIPDNVWFAFATNPTDSNCGSHRLVRSFLDRVIPVQIKSDDVKTFIFKQWLDWAEGVGNIETDIIAYNRWKEGDAFHEYDPNSEDLSQPSPRSWTKLSHILNQSQASGKTLDRFGRGCVGEARWQEYKGFVRIKSELAMLHEIISDPKTALLPSSPDASYAVICNISEGIKNKDSLDKKSVESIINYLRRMDETFAVFGFKMANRAHKDFSSKSVEFGKFCIEHKDMRI
jgi:hypothetical protein|tara:strand:- start:5307 stop:6410 length:1104 start_codon:yes stop_codon:yes gene_type:complete